MLVLFSLPLSYSRARGSVLVGLWSVFVAFAFLCRLWGCLLLFHVFVPSDIVAAAAAGQSSLSAAPLSTFHSSLRQCPLPVVLSLSLPQTSLFLRLSSPRTLPRHQVTAEFNPLSADLVYLLSSLATPQPAPRNADVETGRERRSRCTLVIAVD